MRNDLQSFQIEDIARALGLLSRLPVHVNPEAARLRGARAAWAYPVAGALIGSVAAVAGWIALVLGLGTSAAAIAVLAALALMTGALHEDGLADTADGFWGGATAERRLAIMEDSRVGTYGVLALTIVTLGRFTLIAEIIDAGALFAPVIAAAALSRVPMVAMMQKMPPARPDGLSATVGKPGDPAVWGAIGAGALIGLLFLGGGVFAAILATVLAGGIVARAAAVRIGGQTGDTLGASQQLAELAALATIAAVL